MPMRLLRDWTDSEKVNALTANAETLFVRLIMKADDYGRYFGNPQLLKSYLYPLKDIRVADISRWCAECADAGLIAIYESAGKRYIEILNFGQRLRQKSDSRFPSPPTHDSNARSCDSNMPTCDSNVRLEEEARSENKEIDFFDKKSPSSPKPEKSGASGAAAKEEKIYFAYEGDGKIHGISGDQLARWREMFPAIDVDGELRAASAWLDGNRKLRKKDVRRFLTNWLIRKQDAARGTNGGNVSRNRAGVDYAEVERKAAALRAQQGDDPRFEEVGE